MTCAGSSATARRVPDGEVDGLGEAELLELYRNMVLLRDVRRALARLPPAGPDRHVRDLLGARGHAGGRPLRPRRRGLDLPLLPRVRDRASARHAARGRPLVVARAPGRLVGSARVPARFDHGADRDARPARRRLRLGLAAEGRETPARSRSSATAPRPRARSTKGANFAAVMDAPVVLLCNNNQWAISTPLVRPDPRRDARGQGGRLRHARRARGRRRRARGLRGSGRGARARASR